MPITLNGDTGIQTPMYNGTITANAVTPSVNMKNRIINGAMVIDQRNAGASVTLTSGGVFPVDRFMCFSNNDGVMTGQQDSSAPSGFINSLKITTTTADSSLGSTQYAEVQQNIEGLNTGDLNWGSSSAKTITLSFWVRSSLTGTFGGAIRNSANNRSYAFSYTISSANTWEYKTITIAGDTTGTWLIDSGIGLKVCFGMGAGSTYTGTAGTWTGSTLVQPTGTVSVVGTNGATFYITGVQLEVGSTATSFDYRPYGTELDLCKRYYQEPNSTFWAMLYRGDNYQMSVYQYPVTMRATPTSTYTWNADGGSGAGTPVITAYQWYVSTSATNTSGVNPRATALKLSAEL
jgi:hypothetical protein